MFFRRGRRSSPFFRALGLFACFVGSLSVSVSRGEEPAVPEFPLFRNAKSKIDSPAVPDESISEDESKLAYPPDFQFAEGDIGVYDPDFEYSGLEGDEPVGFAGRSSITPSIGAGIDFLPMEDRWRIGFPDWDRYEKGHPLVGDYPYDPGRLLNPFNQNVLKGDYPIIGQQTFLEVTATSFTLAEVRNIPTGTSAFESTTRPGQEEFFGRGSQFPMLQNVSLSLDLFHGEAAFKPIDWRVKLTPVFSYSYLTLQELAITNPDVRKGTTRQRTWTTLQEWFIEAKLADLSSQYDFVSVRVGSQPFSSDFRGLIFSDTNRGVRLFGTLFGNRDQFNLAYFSQLDKDVNTMLNTFDNRQQDVFIANYFHQDFIWPGYTIQGSVHYNDDGPSFRFDRNNFLVRPDPVGTFQPHRVQAVYLGFAGEGHIDRYNISHAFYWALGQDSNNPLANSSQSINAQMATLELSYDRDWIRFKSSFLWASGDHNINNGQATGFDTILDNPNFAGGQFSYFQRNNLPIFGVNLTNRFSLVPDLRSSKIQGQSNFVNPGLFLLNVGVDLEISPRFRVLNNVNFLWFHSTEVLQQFLFQENVPDSIGTDISVGFEYRPLLSNNVIIVGGVSTLVPGAGFRALYNKQKESVGAQWASFMELILTY